MHSAALIDTNHRLSDLQFSQIMASLSTTTHIWDPNKAFTYHRSMCRRRPHNAPSRTIPDSFWRSPKLRRWSSTDDSALSIVSSTFRARFAMRNLCVDVIEQLNAARVPVLLALRIPESGAATNISTADLLKYLVQQALRLRQSVQTEKSMSLRCATFHEACTEADWFQVLEAALADIGAPVYVVVDLEIVDPRLGAGSDFSWVQAFERFFAALVRRGLETKLKVLLVSYGSLPLGLSAEEYARCVVQAKTRPATARQRKAANRTKSSELPIRLRGVGAGAGRGRRRA